MITYQSFLKNELLKRKSKNPGYSIRSFARDLELSQPFLTQVLNQKRKLGDGKALLIAEKLKLSAKQKKLFISLVRLSLSRDSRSRELLRNEINELLDKNPKYAVLSEDAFSIVADWHYFAILELTSLKSFNSEPQWIAKRLGIAKEEIITAIDRLKRVGLLKEVDGRLVKAEKDYIIEEVPSAAIKKHHQQTLRMASTALQEQHLNEREFMTISMSMDPKKIRRAKEAIREFSEKLMSELQESEPKSVYKLAVQFFRLDKEAV